MTAPLILGTNSVADDRYEIANSCRFDRNDHCLIKTFSSAGNRKKFTFSLWIKLSGRGSGNNNGLLVAGTGGQDEGTIKLSNDSVNWSEYDTGTASVIGNLTTNQLFRDYSAWSHLVFVWDTGNATAGDRMKIYHNGSRITSFSSSTNPTQNYDAQINNNVTHNIARQSWNNSGDFNGYMAEIFFLDGQALTPDSFGEYDSASNIWIPKDCKDDLTFGSNGYYLDFADSSSLGNDVSGNNNDWTINNLTSPDQTTDTPTNNFCTWNGIADNLDASLEQGNTKVSFGSASTRRPVISNFGVSKGKWYWEWEAEGSPTGANIEIGIVNYASPSTQGNYLGQSLQGDADFTTYIGNGTINMSGTTTTGLSTYTGGDIIGVAVDMDNTLIYFYKNGTLVNSGGTNFSGMEDGSGFIFMANADRSGSSTYTANVNFGNPNSAPSSSQSDENGYGNFEYAPPSGYYALCTKNLAEYG